MQGPVTPSPLKAVIGKLRSRRLAIMLMGILSLSLLLGSVIPQEDFTEPEDFRGWQKENPLLFKAADAIGLTSVFTSWWFIAVLLLFFLNTLSFGIEKARIITGRKRSVSTEGFPLLFECRLNAFPKRPEIEQILKEKGFKKITQPEKDAYFAGKGRSYHIGSLLVHMSVLLIFLAGTVTALTRFSGIIEIAEGQTQADRPGGYVWLKKAFGGGGFRGFEVKLLEFIPSYYPNGEPKGHVSRLLFGHDEVWTERRVSIGSPAKFMGTDIYQRDEDGIAVLLGLTDEHGSVLDRSYVLMDKQKKSFSLKTEYSMPAGLSIEGRLLPDAYLEDGGFVSRSYVLRKPILELIVKEKKDILYSGFFFLGDRVKVRELTLAWEDARYWTSYWITRDEGGVLILIAFISGLTGLLMVVFVDERSVLVSFSQGNGLVICRIRGRSLRYQYAFQEEIKEMGRLIEGG